MVTGAVQQQTDRGLAEQVERLVLYFDVFHHPLTVAEVERFVAPGETEAVEAACRDLVARNRVASEGSYLFVPGRAGSVARRRERATNAELRWPAALRASRILAQLPWVHGVLVTGGLSKNSAEPDDDVDFLLLVEPGAVWTLKSTLQVMRKALPPGVRSLFCTNYILDVDHLTIDDQNVFTAVELATAVPMAGPEACAAWLDANRWAERYIPGLSWSRERATRAPAIEQPAWSRFVSDRGAVPQSVEKKALELWEKKLQAIQAGVSGMPHRLIVQSVNGQPELEKYVGKSLRQIGEEEGKHHIEVMIDLSVAGDLNVEFLQPERNFSADFNAEMINDSPYTIPGVSDGGAHTKFFNGGSWTTDFLRWLVRDEAKITLEEAHYRMSALAAHAAGFKDRGVLREGAAADVVVYDMEELDIEPHWIGEVVHDFPGGEWRRVQRAKGYKDILVNGEVTFEDGACTGATPGRLLRHGRG